MSKNISIYIAEEDLNFIANLKSTKTVTSHSQAIRVAMSIMRNYFSDEQIKLEANTLSYIDRRTLTKSEKTNSVEIESL